MTLLLIIAGNFLSIVFGWHLHKQYLSTKNDKLTRMSAIAYFFYNINYVICGGVCRLFRRFLGKKQPQRGSVENGSIENYSKSCIKYGDSRFSLKSIKSWKFIKTDEKINWIRIGVPDFDAESHLKDW